MILELRERGVVVMNSQLGSMVYLILNKTGSLIALQIITKRPTENMNIAWVFFFQLSCRPQRIGNGMIRMMRSWKMEIAAKKIITTKESMHLIGGTLYIQLVQLP